MALFLGAVAEGFSLLRKAFYGFGEADLGNVFSFDVF